MNPRPTPYGAGVLGALAALAGVAVLSRDAAIAVAALALALAVAYDSWPLLRSIMRGCRASVHGAGRFWVWEEPVLGVEGSGCRGDSLESLPKWLRVEAFEASGEGFRASLRASFPYKGVYRLEGLRVSSTSRFGWLRGYVLAEARAEVEVLPEVLYWTVVALRLLGLGGGASVFSVGESRAPSIVRGASGIYHWTREYVAGESPRRIDWRATGRRMILMIKEYRLESPGEPVLAYDMRCLGPYTCDAVASAAISSAATALARGERMAGLYLVDEGRAYSFRGQRQLLAYLVSRALESRLVEEAEIYEFIEPPAGAELSAILAKIAGEPLEVEAPGAWAGGALIVSSIVHDVSSTVDLVHSTVSRGFRALVVAPAKPWLDSRSLEEAYRVYRTLELAHSKIKGLGSEILWWHRGPAGRAGARRLKLPG